jgi:hypothetical protein
LPFVLWLFFPFPFAFFGSARNFFLNFGEAGPRPEVGWAAVLELIPGIDENIAQAIIQMRAGPDGSEGNEDDTPFRTVGELVNVPGIGRQMTGAFQRFFTVRSLYFEVHVFAQINTYKREYVALLRRNNARDVQTLYFYWK